MKNAPPPRRIPELTFGDSLAWLDRLPPAIAAAVITDPPYASGGTHANERARPPAEKYVQHGSRKFAGASFAGDTLDQRSWTRWSATWMAAARRCTRPGGYLLAFCDWRQLPATTDALQHAGWLWRGVVAWDKGLGARAPHKGYCRHQCEYIVWGTNGSFDRRHLPAEGPLPGCHQVSVKKSDKFHPTGKPVELMRRLVMIARPGELVLDPFAGSGSTLRACRLEGRRGAGCEVDPHWHRVAKGLLSQLPGAGLSGSART